MSRRSSTGSSKRGAVAKPRGARVLHLDCFSGIAGNMFLGALLDAGLSRRDLEEDLAGLDLPHRLVVKRVHRGALAARYVDVLAGAERRPRARSHSHSHSHSHGRHYKEIVAVLEKARLDKPVRDRALAIIDTLGPGDRVGLFTAARPARAIIHPASSDHAAIIRLLNELERKVVAHHEMGHAMVAGALQTTDKVHKVCRTTRWCPLEGSRILKESP